jgi:hypothetical protein
MTDDMRPPQEIWLDDEAIADHFDSVKARLSSGSGNAGSSEDWEEVPVQNELTRGLRKG